MSDNVQEILNDLAIAASFVIRESFEICAPLYKKESKVPEDVQFIIANLMSNCHMTSDSALILIANYRLWDVEMLQRSIFEGTIKLLYLCHGDEEAMVTKTDEYWRIIPEIKLISRHKKATNLLSKLDNGSKNWFPIRELLLSSEELSKLEDKYPKKFRKQLEQKWSFSEMINTLSKSNIKRFDTLIAAYHGYSMGSHLIHQDGDAVGLIWDRNTRGEERRVAIELAHGARLLSDIVSLSIFRSSIYYELHQLDVEHIKNLFKKLEDFSKILKIYYEEWFTVEYNNH